MPAASARRPIALVGMMGAGKTCVGRELARRLDLPFHDSDGRVERAAGCTLVEIFSRYGEAGFRERERMEIEALLQLGRIVIATGGGAMAHAPTRTLLLDRSLTIWLEAEPAVLARRLAGTRNRPLLESLDRGEALKRLLDERRPFYALATHRIRTDGQTADGVADILLPIIDP